MHLFDKLRLGLDGLGLPLALMGVEVSLFAWLARMLLTGTASAGPDLDFRRDEEPREYWSLVTIAIVGIVVCTVPFWAEL